MKTPTLEAAFRATTYRVETPEEGFNLRIGQAHRAFDCLLEKQGVSYWGIVTACNPGGVQTADQNAVRNEALLARIRASGWRYYFASNHADFGGWPVEPGFCVLGVDEAALRALAFDFAQLAIVVGEVGKGARLVWLSFGEDQ